MKKLLLVLLIVCSRQAFYAQTYEFVKQFSTEENKQFLGQTKEIFKLNSNFSMGLSVQDAATSLKDMIDQVQYNEAYLKKNEAALKKDSLNPYFSNNLAMYYESKQDAALSTKYFKKARNNLDYLVKVQKDSAKFYSFRGLLNYHLQEKDPLPDMEKALKINPKDSIADTFYPVFLINKRRFADSKLYCINKLDGNPENPAFAYTMFYGAYFWEVLSIITNEDTRNSNAQKEYDDLVDYKTINKYSEKFKGNAQVQNIRTMIDVSNLFIKMIFFKPNESGTGFVLNFSEREKKKIASLQSDFTELLKKEKINPFSGNKCLSFLSYMQNKQDKAIEYAQKAIEALPKNKQSDNFNCGEMFDLLLSVYNGNKDYTKYQKILEDKLANGLDKSSLSNDYRNMSALYLYQNNLEKTEEWCKKAKAIDPDNFYGLRLLAHLYFLKDNISLSQYYGESASKNMTEQEDSANLSLQFAIYMILNGNSEVAKSAYDNIVAAKKSLGGNCRICDDLLLKYIKVNP